MVFMQNPGDTAAVVLVIEDDPILMLSLVAFVEEAGCEALEATTMGEAIEILEQRTDVRTVFSDLDMQDAAAGLKLAMLIRDRWPPIELLMVSAHPRTAEELPLRGVLVGKPFDQRKIVSAIRRFAT